MLINKLYGWKCAICYKTAPVLAVDVTLCVKHSKQYNFGYGKTLVEMQKEYERKNS